MANTITNPKLFIHETQVDKEFTNVYTKMSNIKGVTGAKGDTGLTGATGATGPAGPGVPTGGTAGQILSKIDATDYNTQWENAPSGLPTQTGNNGKFLTTDGTNASWATVTSGGGGVGDSLYLFQNCR